MKKQKKQAEEFSALKTRVDEDINLIKEELTEQVSKQLENLSVKQEEFGESLKELQQQRKDFLKRDDFEKMFEELLAKQNLLKQEDLKPKVTMIIEENQSIKTLIDQSKLHLKSSDLEEKVQ